MHDCIVNCQPFRMQWVAFGRRKAHTPTSMLPWPRSCANAGSSSTPHTVGDGGASPPTSLVMSSCKNVRKTPDPEGLDPRWSVLATTLAGLPWSARPLSPNCQEAWFLPRLRRRRLTRLCLALCRFRWLSTVYAPTRNPSRSCCT